MSLFSTILYGSKVILYGSKVSSKATIYLVEESSDCCEWSDSLWFSISRLSSMAQESIAWWSSMSAARKACQQLVKHVSSPLPGGRACQQLVKQACQQLVKHVSSPLPGGRACQQLVKHTLSSMAQESISRAFETRSERTYDIYMCAHTSIYTWCSSSSLPPPLMKLFLPFRFGVLCTEKYQHTCITHMFRRLENISTHMHFFFKKNISTRIHICSAE